VVRLNLRGFAEAFWTKANVARYADFAAKAAMMTVPHISAVRKCFGDQLQRAPTVQVGQSCRMTFSSEL